VCVCVCVNMVCVWCHFMEQGYGTKAEVEEA